MTDSQVRRKRCNVRGCPRSFAVYARRKRCLAHQGRPWYELWAHREAAGLTVRQLAIRAGIPGVRGEYLYSLQRGDRMPSPRHIQILADALGVKPEQLQPDVRTAIPDGFPYEVVTDSPDEPVAEVAG
jgi:lambda repressor-like predicted transcriptional regulator